MKLQYKAKSLAARFVLLCALVLASFAHTAFPMKVSAPAGFDERAYAAQYMLPDGTLPVLCDRTNDGKQHTPSAVPCEFCQISFSCINADVPQRFALAKFQLETISFVASHGIDSTNLTWRKNAPSHAPPLT